MPSEDSEQLKPKKFCPVCQRQFQSEIARCPTDQVLLVYPDKLIGAILDGRYEILSVLGQGGMSVVYKARHIALERLVAIKVLKAHLSNDPNNLKRFQREAHAASSLQHPHIINVYSIGISEDGQPYLALEFLEGQSLAGAMLEKKPLNILRALDIAIQTADALEHAHSRGVIHRDLKPSNIMLTKSAQADECVKIVDFGTAKLLPGNDKHRQQLTRAGEILGTLAYMSPEQKQGGTVDARSDIYSLGLILYEALSDDCKIPQAVKPLITRALEDDPEKRYQSAAEIRRDLERIKSSVLAGSAPKAAAIVRTGSHARTKPDRRRSDRLLVGALSIILLSVLAWLTAVSASRETKLSWQYDLESFLRMPEKYRLLTLGELAQCYADNGEPERITDLYEKTFLKALSARTAPADAEGASISLCRFGELFCRSGRFAEAVKVLSLLDQKREFAKDTQGARPLALYSKACLDLRETILSSVPARRETLPILLALGDSYCRHRYFDRAEKIFADAYMIERKFPGQDRVPEAATLLRLQQVYLEQHRLDKAEAAGKQALAINCIGRAGFEELRGEVNIRLADIFLGQSRLDEALPCYEHALAVLKPAYNTVSANINLASIYCKCQRYSDAEKCLNTAWQTCDQANLEPRMKAIAFINMGWLFLRQQKFARAEDCFRKALSLMGDTAYTDLSTTGLMDGLIDSLKHQHKYDEAEKCLSQALSIEDKAGKKFEDEAAWTRIQLGIVLADTGRLPEAVALIKQSILIRQRLDGSGDLRSAIGNFHLANIYFRQKKYAESEILFEQCAEIAEKHLTDDNPTFLVDAANGLASACMQQEKYQRAESAFAKALAACQPDSHLANVPAATLSATADGLLRLYKLQGKDPFRQKTYRAARLLLARKH